MTPFLFSKRDVPSDTGVTAMTDGEIAQVSGGDPKYYTTPGGTRYTRYEIQGGFGYHIDD